MHTQTKYGNSAFSPAQIHLLEMMSYIKTPASLAELRKVLADFYAKRVSEEMDKLWDSGVVNDEVVEDWKNAHLRTPYHP